MAKQTFSLLFMIRRVSLLKTGESPIYMRLTLAGQRIEFQLKRRVYPKLWNQKKERATGKDPVSIEINNYLDSIRSRIYIILREIEDEGLPITLTEIKDRFNGSKSQAKKCRMFFEVFQEEVDRMESLIGKGYENVTVGRYKLCLRYIKEMYARQSKAQDIALKDISNVFIVHFETFLKVDKDCCQNTVIRYMKCFKKIINIGLANGWIKINPFLGIKFKEEKVRKDVLTLEEVMRIYNKEFSIPRLERTRDIFIFCCWTGLAFIDVSDLGEKDFVIDAIGNPWINRLRIKTGIEANIPLTKIPLEILEKYKNDKYCTEKGKVLPVDTNQRMNGFLKEIADICGIQKRLTTHTARHTFATLLIADHAAMKNVASMLGHSSIKMTERYAKVQDCSILYDMNKFSEKI